METVTLTSRSRYLALLSLVISACATTVPSPDIINPVERNLFDYPSLSVTVTARDGVSVSPIDLDGMTRAVVDAINRARSTASWAQAGATGPLRMSVELTRYEPGNEFARFMLAGLGQIHVDGEVVLLDSAASEEIGRYSVSKTFAWGGVYGASTRIGDIVPAFAESVARGVER